MSDILSRSPVDAWIMVVIISCESGPGWSRYQSPGARGMYVLEGTSQSIRGAQLLEKCGI